MSTAVGFEAALSGPIIWRHIQSATQYALNLPNCFTNIHTPADIGCDNQIQIQWEITKIRENNDVKQSNKRL